MPVDPCKDSAGALLFRHDWKGKSREKFLSVGKQNYSGTKMHLCKNILKILLILSIISLFGCMTLKGQMSSDYQLAAHPDEGLVAFTVSCNAFTQNPNLGPAIEIHKASDRNLAGVFAKAYSAKYNCNSRNDPLSTPELKIMSLPVGEYYALWWLMSSNYNSVYFNVTPGKLNYLGRLELVADGRGESATWGTDLTKTVVENKAAIDIPKIKSQLPLLQNRDIQIMLFNPPPPEFR